MGDMNRPIHSYENWLKAEELKESEKIEPTVAPTTPTEDPDGPEPPSDLTPAEQAAGTEPEVDTDAEPTTSEVPSTEGSEIDQFTQIDQTRRDAITAFKEKQKEYMDIPAETRKNPVSEEDKQKVESIKSELITLNTAMKDAITAYDKFNNEMLGLSDEGDENDTTEP